MSIYSYPLLCTRGAVIFPMQDLAVEVGRQVSIDAVNYANAYNSNIVIVSQKDLQVDNPGPDDVYNVGTICRIKTSRERDDHLKVIFSGITRCRIVKHFIKDDVNFVEVEEIYDVVENEDEIEIITKKALAEFNVIAQKYSRPGFPIRQLTVFDSALASVLADTFAQIKNQLYGITVLQFAERIRAFQFLRQVRNQRNGINALDFLPFRIENPHLQHIAEKVSQLCYHRPVNITGSLYGILLFRT